MPSASSSAASPTRQVGYVAGKVSFGEPEGTNREGLYWRYELWLRGRESAAGSITGGNGAIYAVRRADYVEVDPRFGHDLTFPYVTVQHGMRAVYDAEARAWDRPARDLEDEYGRKVRMFEHCWLILVRGGMLRGVGPLYAFELFAHRVLRYASGLLHVVLLATSLALVTSGLVYELVLAAQIALLVLALAGRLRIPDSGRGDRLLLRARHLGDGRRALPLRALRRAPGLGEGRGHAVKRAVDLLGAGVGLALASPVVGIAAARDQAGRRRPGLLPPAAGGRATARSSTCSSCAR